MSGSGIKDLSRQPTHDELSARALKWFAQRHAADRAESRALTWAASLPNAPYGSEAALRLAYKLDYECRKEAPPSSRASRVTCNLQRDELGIALQDLLIRDIEQRIRSYEQHGTINRDEISFVTLIPRGGDVPLDNMAGFDPIPFKRQLSADIDRAIQKHGLEGEGWGIFFHDCEVQLSEGVARNHWHGFVSGRELEAVDLLRNTPKYFSPKASPGGLRDAVRQRVRVTRQPLTNLRYFITYPVKDHWNGRRVASNQEGNRERSFKTRLRQPWRTVERLFFDKYSLQDISLLRGLRVIDGRLTPTR